MQISNFKLYNTLNKIPFKGEIDPTEYVIRRIEFEKALSTGEEPAVHEEEKVEADEDAIFIERMRAQFASREAEIKYLKEINGEFEPRTAPVIIPPETIEGNKIDIKA